MQVMAELEGPFPEWLSAVDQELIERIREGCGRFPHWRSGLHGSLKAFQKRHRHRAQFAATVSLRLDQPAQQIGGDWEDSVPPMTFDNEYMIAQRPHQLSPSTPPAYMDDDYLRYCDPSVMSNLEVNPFEGYLQYMQQPQGMFDSAGKPLHHPRPPGVEFDSIGNFLLHHSQPSLLYDAPPLPNEQATSVDPRVLQNNNPEYF
jgi:hypothetical protein